MRIDKPAGDWRPLTTHGEGCVCAPCVEVRADAPGALVAHVERAMLREWGLDADGRLSNRAVVALSYFVGVHAGLGGLFAQVNDWIGRGYHADPRNELTSISAFAGDDAHTETCPCLACITLRRGWPDGEGVDVARTDRAIMREWNADSISDLPARVLLAAAYFLGGIGRARDLVCSVNAHLQLGYDAGKRGATKGTLVTLTMPR